MTKKRPTVALVLAGGQSTRAGVGLPKQYRKLAGKPLLRWSLETLCQHEKIDYVKVVIHPNDEQLYRDVIADAADYFPPRKVYIPNGKNLENIYIYH